MEVGQALVRLGAEAGDLQGHLDKAKGQTNSWAKGVGKNVRTLLGGAVLGGVTAVAGAVVGIGKAAGDMAADTKSAQSEVRAQFGFTQDAAERTAELARKAWGENWGESITDVATAMGTVQQQLGELGVTSDQEISTLTQHALGLRDTYEIDVGQGIDAAKTLMEQFGLSGQEAFDFIAEGQQRGLDRSGDFLDTINEYSVQFAEADADAGQFFSALETGLQGGMLGTDKAADAFKEFRVRIMDGSATTRDALNNIGISADFFTNELATGGMTVTEAWGEVQEALRNTDDEALRMQAGVGLIGTQYEDLGEEAILAMDLAQTSTDELAGATDALGAKYESLGSLFEAGKRRILVALSPIADMMLELGNVLIPIIFAQLEKWAPVIENIAAIFGQFFTTFVTSLQEGQGPLQALTTALATFLPPDLVAQLQGFLATLQGIWDSIVSGLEPVIEAILQFVSWKDILIIVAGAIAAVVIPAIAGLVGTLISVLAPIAIVIGVVAALRKAWESNFLGIRDIVNRVIGWLVPFISNAIAQIRAWWEANGAQILANAQLIWNTIMAVINTVINTIWSIIQAVLAAIRSAWEAHGAGIMASAQAVWSAIQGVISTVINTIQTIITTVANAILSFWQSHGEAIMAGASEAWETVKGIVDSTFGNIQTLLDTFTSLFTGDWEGFGEGIGELWQAGWDNVVAILDALWSLISPVLGGLWADIQGWFTGIDWASLGRQIVQGIINGLTSMAGNLFGAVKGIIKGALSSGEEAAESSSPSKRMIRLGRDMGKGLVIGLGDMAGAAARAGGGLARAVTTTNVTNNYWQLTANYPMQPEGSLAGDIRAIQLLREA